MGGGQHKILRGLGEAAVRMGSGKHRSGARQLNLEDFWVREEIAPTVARPPSLLTSDF
jgi:hypothetical protein